MGVGLDRADDVMLLVPERISGGSCACGQSSPAVEPPREARQGGPPRTTPAATRDRGEDPYPGPARGPARPAREPAGTPATAGTPGPHMSFCAIWLAFCSVSLFRSPASRSAGSTSRPVGRGAVASAIT